MVTKTITMEMYDSINYLEKTSDGRRFIQLLSGDVIFFSKQDLEYARLLELAGQNEWGKLFCYSFDYRHNQHNLFFPETDEEATYCKNQVAGVERERQKKKKLYENSVKKVTNEIRQSL